MRRGFAAFGERGEEGDIERMREAENIGDQAVMIIEAHDHLFGHRRREQRLHRLERFSASQINKDDVASGEKLRVRTEHRMNEVTLQPCERSARSPARRGISASRYRR